MAVQEYPAPDSVSRLQTRAFGVGAIALLLALYGAIHSPQTFFASYLMSFLLVLSVTLGSLALVMLQHLTAGHWGVIIRRPLESATRTLPLLVIAFLRSPFLACNTCIAGTVMIKAGSTLRRRAKARFPRFKRAG